MHDVLTPKSLALSKSSRSEKYPFLLLVQILTTVVSREVLIFREISHDRFQGLSRHRGQAITGTSVSGSKLQL